MDPTPFILFFAVSALLGISVLGAILAPYAAIHSYREASSHRLSGLKYTIMGAVCSLLFLFPWYYLNARLQGQTLSTALVVFALILLYSTWVLGPIGFLLFLLMAQDNPEVGRFLGTLVAMVFLLTASLLLILVATLRRNSNDDWLKDASIMMPFAGAWISTVIVMPLMS